MTEHISVGLPGMQKEAHERRAFLPDFVQHMTRFATVYLAKGYGSRMGFHFDDYQQGNPRVIEVERREAFEKDYVLILRSPNEEEFSWIRAGSCLISMLHYPTRAQRIELLKYHRIKSISIDSIVDDCNMRLVENFHATAWNGLEAAFDRLEKRWPDLRKDDGEPFRTLVLGTGMVGRNAVAAAVKLGNIERNNQHIKNGRPGSIATAIGRNASRQEGVMKALMRQADILVDATQRCDASRPVVSNRWIDWLPEHAVVVDLAVDPYLLDRQPVVVRGIEGIPTGDLDQYIFEPDDPNWERTVPEAVPSTNRRTVVSCYSWPGIHPEASMVHYGRQLLPLMETLLSKGYDHLSLEGGCYERALARAMLPE